MVVTHNVQGTALLKAKIGLLKAKAVAVAAPHVAARIAVAKEVKAKKAFAFAQSIAAVRCLTDILLSYDLTQRFV